MFYCVDILRKNGKFGVVWLAATRDCSLKKRDYLSISTRSKCLELIDYILHQGKKKPRLSLYLSSQLTYGVVKVYSKQIDYFLNDVKEVVSKVKYRPQCPSIDCPTPKNRKPSKFADTSLLVDYNLLDASRLMDDLSLVHALDPQNFWQPGMLEREGVVEEGRHTVPMENITMSIDAAIIDHHLNKPVGLLEDVEILPPLPTDAFVDKTKSIDQDTKKDQTEDQPVTTTPAKTQDDSIIDRNVEEAAKRMSQSEKQSRRAQMEDRIMLASLEPAKKRMKRKKVLVDDDIMLSKQHLATNIADTSSILRENIDVCDSRLVSAQSLMQQPAIQTNQWLNKHLKDFYKSLLITDKESDEDIDDGEIVMTNIQKRPKPQQKETPQIDSMHHAGPMLTSTAVKSFGSFNVDLHRDASASREVLLEQSKSLLNSNSLLKHSSNILSSSNLSQHRRSERSSKRISQKENLPTASIIHNESHYNTLFIEELLKEDAAVPTNLHQVAYHIVDQAADAVQGNEVLRDLTNREEFLSPRRASFRQESICFDDVYERIKSSDRELTLRQLIPASATRAIAARLFFKVLEKVKDKQLKVKQDSSFGDIYIKIF